MKTLKSILLVDDSEATNAMNLYLLKRIKAADHIEVRENGKTALDFLTQKNEAGQFPHPDLIILDLNMPVMNGIEFLEEHEKLEDHVKGTAVIIMLTTSLLESDKQKVNSFPSVSGYQTKPLSLEKITDIMSHFSDDS